MRKYEDSTLKGRTKDELIGIIRCLEHNLEAVEEMNANQFKLLMEKDKYRWHDLRKNPEDLPKEMSKVLIAREDKNGCIGHHTTIFKGYFLISPLHTIAWREIEPFEEVEE